jgi:tRNA modification GTPase
LQAEAVADLIHAKSTRALNVAANQLQGVLSQQIKLIRDELVRTLSFIEANLDFIEEDIPPLSWKEMETQLSQVKKNLSQFISSSMEGKLLREGIRIVLTGKPNVGKSSLFNALLAHDRAIVTPIPGTTRDTLEESLDWNGFPVVLVDTAGLRHTEDIVESQGTTRAKQASQAADIILIVIDGSSPLDVEDKEILKHGYQGKTLVVVNKSDLPSQITTQEFEQLGISSTVRVSAQTRTGLMDLKKEVQNLVLFSEDENSSVSTVVGLRHLHHLKACLIKVDAALRCILGKKSEEAISLDVKAAIEELDFMTGENVNDDVLNAIFRQFCIGK